MMSRATRSVGDGDAQRLGRSRESRSFKPRRETERKHFKNEIFRALRKRKATSLKKKHMR